MRRFMIFLISITLFAISLNTINCKKTGDTDSQKSEEATFDLDDETIMRIGVNVMTPWKMEIDGKIEGAEIVIMREVAKKLNLKPVFQVAPWKRCMKHMEEGKYDIMTGVLRRAEREEFLHFIDPPYKTKSNKAFYVLKGKENTIIKYEDLYKITIGVDRGAKMFPRFDNDAKLIKFPTARTEQRFKMLIAKRFDAMILTESTGDYSIKELGLDDKIGKAKFGFYKTNPVYMVISKKSLLAKKRKDEAINVISKMIKDGTVDKILQKYFKDNKLPVPVYK